ncbi:LacI family DNA-binding transcriptional regulator [Kutzneria sp. 744]|uniref:LacI family DNA-binding transcriptional regulator n=1 Tax=Kutzneria sp. (strain 744) TaxID=345341 RepID=UPI001E4786D4|nr:LacI family DNA-binding transcriptional regulator [Kutzneria sp. 744]
MLFLREADAAVLNLTDVRPTLVDVAHAAGVSLATASRVLNGFHHVRPETRRQVVQAVDRLGYVRQRAGRAHEPQRAGLVAVTVCEDGSRLFADPYFSRILWGINRELAAADHDVVLLTVESARNGKSPALRHLRSDHVDGALIVSMHARHAGPLERVGVPMVVVGRPVGADPTRYSSVDVDNHGGAALAVRHLIETGRTRIATVAGPKDMSAGVDRLAGFSDALTDAGRFDPGLVVHGDFSLPSGEHAALRLLDRRPDVDAIFAASDLMAVGVMRVLRRLGRRVPEDVAVIGFDDAPIARTTDPPLTTVGQPVEELGAQSARELLAILDGTVVEHRQAVLGTNLVLRDSA